jgi:hypothetical protein
MSLRRAKAIYCVVMISVAIVLACTAGLIGWITAVLLLSGALPIFGAVKQAAGDMMLTAVENRNRERATPEVPRAEDLPDSDRRGIPPATHQ